jgi:protein phosphatase
MSGSSSFEIGAATHVGRVRKRNEDSYIARPDIGVVAVCDGMGGHEAGDVASATIVEALANIAPQGSAANLLTHCEEAILLANAKIRMIAAERGVDVMGATIVALLTFDRYYACLWAGDSRAYLVRQQRIAQLTRDHTEAAMLLADGVLSEEEARNWPRRNVITRAIGVRDDVELELENGELAPGDIFVLCSDGLTGHVEPHEIQAIVETQSPDPACRELINLALQRGGRDNVTVIVLRYGASNEQVDPRRLRALQTCKSTLAPVGRKSTRA